MSLEQVNAFSKGEAPFQEAWLADDALLTALYADDALFEALCAHESPDVARLIAEAHVLADNAQGALGTLATSLKQHDDDRTFERMVELFVDAPIVGEATDAMDVHLARPAAEDVRARRAAHAAVMCGAVVRASALPAAAETWRARRARWLEEAGGLDGAVVAQLPRWAGDALRRA